eukprot:TRINITY_DN1742_c0_g1_i2.p1 TRINITY_DN1742_c0_g1~~TRINITY_DN1742_c0_g1_i2.p1  ORF type:complete len:108 (-),score=35.89 TRINITY_DN1742_c0_g1_i2:53-376(-)
MSIPAGDAANGEKLFKAKCTQCHTVNEGGPHKQGPNLFGIVGRPAGTVPRFAYTKANAESGITWNEKELFDYLLDPKKYIPKTKMNFPGFKSEQDRADVVAYLKQFK